MAVGKIRYGIALGTLLVFANTTAAQARSLNLSASLDQTTENLAVTASSDCVSSNFCYQDHDLIFKVDSEHIVAEIRQPDGDPSQTSLALYEERSNGGLYLVDLAEQKKILRINAGWWFEKLISANWSKDGSMDQIAISATFITGVGPTGVQPFPASFILTKTKNHGFKVQQRDE